MIKKGNFSFMKIKVLFDQSSEIELFFIFGSIQMIKEVFGEKISTKLKI